MLRSLLCFSCPLIACFLLLGGCGLTNQKLRESPASKEVLQGKISVWSELPVGISVNHSKVIQALVRQELNQFINLNPGTQVTLKFFPAQTAIDPFIHQSKRGGGPNILHVAFTDRINELIEHQSIQALNQYQIDLSSLRPETLDQVRLGEKLYGIPTNLQTQVLCYNKAKVKAHQLPNTLSELITQARNGYSVGIHSGFAEAIWGIGIFMRQSPHSQQISNRDIGQGWSQWLQWLQQADNEPNLHLLDSPGELQQLFIEHKLTYITCWSGWIPSLREKLGADQLGIARLPHKTNHPATPIILVDSLFFNRSSSPQQMKIALELAKFLTNSEQQQKMQLSLPANIPVNQSFQVNAQLYPLQATLRQQSRSGVILSLSNSKQFGQSLDQLTSLYQQVIAGQISPTQAELSLTDTLNQLSQPALSFPSP